MPMEKNILLSRLLTPEQAPGKRQIVYLKKCKAQLPYLYERSENARALAFKQLQTCLILNLNSIGIMVLDTNVMSPLFKRGLIWCTPADYVRMSSEPTIHTNAFARGYE